VCDGLPARQRVGRPVLESLWAALPLRVRLRGCVVDSQGDRVAVVEHTIK